MISFDDALAIVLKNTPLLAERKVALKETAGCTLAEDIVSDVDMPPFNKSAMDGYAVRSDDLRDIPVKLKIIEDIPAGSRPTKEIGPGQCARIMTGAPVPEGADTVVMQERTEDDGHGTVTILEPASAGLNICLEAENLKAEDTVLRRGTVIRPSEIALLGAVGKSEVKIYRRPRAALLATGNEIVEIDATPSPGQIRNSSSHAVISRLYGEGIETDYLGIAGDDPANLRAALEKGIGEYDIFMVTGGVSVGRYDLVKDQLRQLGTDIRFEKVAVKPGKPTVFGTNGKCVVFGLPGNPVSTLVLVELLVVPCIRTMMGHPEPVRPPIQAVLDEPISSRRQRDVFLPVRLYYDNGTWRAVPVEYHGSADIVGLSRANALARIKPGGHISVYRLF